MKVLRKITSLLLLFNFHVMDAIDPSLLQSSLAFASTHSQTKLRKTGSHNIISKDKVLSMSTISSSEDNKRNMMLEELKKKCRESLPPEPEDKFILTGDIASILVYSFMDHVFGSLLSEDCALQSLVASSSTQVPVWSEVSLHNFGSPLLRAILTQQHDAHMDGSFSLEQLSVPHFSPILQSGGISFVVLASCWLLSGYLNRSFLFQNTVGCNPHQAVKITFRTWILAAGMMMTFCLLASGINPCGCETEIAINGFALKGLSLSDAEFIFDSLTVLLIWRFLVASLMSALF